MLTNRTKTASAYNFNKNQHMLANAKKFYMVCVWRQTQQIQTYACKNLKSRFIKVKRNKSTTFAGKNQHKLVHTKKLIKNRHMLTTMMSGISW